MNPALKARLEESFRGFPVLVASGVSENEIRDLENWAGFLLPDAYKKFLREFGGAIVGPFPVYGLRRAEAMGTDEDSSIAVTTRYRNQGWPDVSDWLIISSDHSGNPIGMDSEGQIWLYDHDARCRTLISGTFEGFLEKCIK